MKHTSDIPNNKAAGAGALTWDGPAIGLLDLDAFFASVEQLDHPEWRSKPVIVGGSPEKRGVVSTASYEARQFGVHSAMPSALARRLCPDAIWTPGHFDRYNEMSRAVMSCILEETPRIEQVSIDEAFFDITPGRFSNEHPAAICMRIQKRVEKLGVTCSIGLGRNKTVAKIASEQDKPRGLTVIPGEATTQFLAPLPVRALSGIGKAADEKLKRMGIFTLGQLARTDPAFLQAQFGVVAQTMIVRASGNEVSYVNLFADTSPIKSISSERTFAKDLHTREEIISAISHIAGLVAARLREKKLAGHTVTLKLKFHVGQQKTAQMQLKENSCMQSVLAASAQKLLDHLWKPGYPVRLIGISVSDFGDPRESRPQQLSLFDANLDALSDEKTNDAAHQQKLAKTYDELRKRFGSQTLSYGYDLRYKHMTSDTPKQS